VWDNDTSVNAQVQLANAQVADVLQIIGQQNKYPVTGTLNLHGNAAGTLNSLSGGGSIDLTNGVAYGEGYQAVSADLTVKGKDIEASRILLKAHDMQIAGNGGYDLTSERFHAHVQGNNLQLSKFDTVKKLGVAADGTLTLVADANGTIEQPGLTAKVKLANVTVSGQAVGEISADRPQRRQAGPADCAFDAGGSPKLDASGQAQLTGNYDAQVKLTVAGLDVGKAMDLFAPSAA
jgi:translocation and assembly module TamB